VRARNKQVPYERIPPGAGLGDADAEVHNPLAHETPPF
jgi:hypothetical protein